MDYPQFKWPAELARCEIEFGTKISKQSETQVRHFDNDWTKICTMFGVWHTLLEDTPL